MAKKKSAETITFRADPELLAAMRGVENRSEFIRSAVLAALESTCPLCRGTGFLSADQRKHWEQFARNHSVQECNDCHAFHLVCSSESGANG